MHATAMYTLNDKQREIALLFQNLQKQPDSLCLLPFVQVKEHKLE